MPGYVWTQYTWTSFWRWPWCRALQEPPKPEASTGILISSIWDKPVVQWSYIWNTKTMTMTKQRQRQTSAWQASLSSSWQPPRCSWVRAKKLLLPVTWSRQQFAIKKVFKFDKICLNLIQLMLWNIESSFLDLLYPGDDISAWLDGPISCQGTL